MVFTESDSSPSTAASSGERIIPHNAHELVSDVDLRVLEGRLRVLDMHRKLSAFHWKHFEEMLSATGVTPGAADVMEEADLFAGGAALEGKMEEPMCCPIKACCLLGEHSGRSSHSSVLPCRRGPAQSSHLRPDNMGLPSCHHSMPARDAGEHTRKITPQLSAKAGAQPADSPRHRALLSLQVPDWQDSPLSSPGTGLSDLLYPSLAFQKFASPQPSPGGTTRKRASRSRLLKSKRVGGTRKAQLEG